MEGDLQADIPMGDDSNFVFDNVLDNVNGPMSRAASEAEEVRQKGKVNGRKRVSTIHFIPLKTTDPLGCIPDSL